MLLRGPGAMLGSLGRGHLALPKGPQQGVADRPLTCQRPKRGANLALAEGSKQQQEDFACIGGPPRGVSH